MHNEEVLLRSVFRHIPPQELCAAIGRGLQILLLASKCLLKCTLVKSELALGCQSFTHLSRLAIHPVFWTPCTLRVRAPSLAASWISGSSLSCAIDIRPPKHTSVCSLELDILDKLQETPVWHWYLDVDWQTRVCLLDVSLVEKFLVALNLFGAAIFSTPLSFQPLPCITCPKRVGKMWSLVCIWNLERTETKVTR